jgi:hypothetical protein
MPSFTHQIESLDNPPAPRLAKGVPLSVRILSGNPYSRNAVSNTGHARRVFVDGIATQRNNFRLNESVIVNG